MEERVGAYIIDSDGNAVPDLNDEAMAARQKAVSLRNETQNIKLVTAKIETVYGTDTMSAAANDILYGSTEIVSNDNPPPVPPITTFEGKPPPAGDN